MPETWCPVCGEGRVPAALAELISAILANEAKTREMEAGSR